MGQEKQEGALEALSERGLESHAAKACQWGWVKESGREPGMVSPSGMVSELVCRSFLDREYPSVQPQVVPT